MLLGKLQLATPGRNMGDERSEKSEQSEKQFPLVLYAAITREADSSLCPE